MSELNRWVVSSLLFARVIYSINWFNIASIFSLIALDFKQDVSLLGLLTTSFLIGVGLFQVPGGILAAIQGSRKTAIYGIIIASSAAPCAVYLLRYNKWKYCDLWLALVWHYFLVQV